MPVRAKGMDNITCRIQNSSWKQGGALASWHKTGAKRMVWERAMRLLYKLRPFRSRLVSLCQPPETERLKVRCPELGCGAQQAGKQTDLQPENL